MAENPFGVGSDDPYGLETAGADVSFPPDFARPVMPGVAPAAPGRMSPFDNPQVQAIIRKHEQSIAGREPQIQELMDKQDLTTDQMARILDETTSALKASRSGGTNLPMLAMGAAMMNTPGGIGRQIGAGLGAMVPAIQQQRAEEDQYQMQVANLALKRAALEQAPLKTKLEYLKAQQAGDIGTIRGIETTLTKDLISGGAGRDPADLKKWEAYNAGLPENEKISYPEYQKIQARLGANKNDPADLRKYSLYSEQARAAGETPKPYNEWAISLEGQKAGAKTTGKAEATAAFNLPKTENTINQTLKVVDRLENHPGLENYVGKPWGPLAAMVPSSATAGAATLHDQLTSEAFLESYAADMRGTGAISNIEGLKAAQAKLRAAQKLSPKEYKEALNEFRDRLHADLETARKQAGQKSEARDATAAPAAPAETKAIPKAGDIVGKTKDGRTVVIGPDGQQYVR